MIIKLEGFEVKHCLMLLVCIFCSLNVGCKKKNIINGVPDRPEGFPEILIPMDGAVEVRYLSPEIGKIAEGAYLILFWVDEEYPASKTIEKIQKQMQSQGCVRVEGSVLSDLTSLQIIEGEGLNKKVIDVSDEFKESLKHSDRPTETQWRKPDPLADYADIIEATWSEEWITHNDDMVSICLQYYFPQKGNGDLRLWVQVTLFTPSSWQYPNVLRYKKNHSEQFNDLEN